MSTATLTDLGIAAEGETFGPEHLAPAMHWMITDGGVPSGLFAARLRTRHGVDADRPIPQRLTQILCGARKPIDLIEIGEQARDLDDGWIYPIPLANSVWKTCSLLAQGVTPTVAVECAFEGVHVWALDGETDAARINALRAAGLVTVSRTKSPTGETVHKPSWPEVGCHSPATTVAARAFGSDGSILFVGPDTLHQPEFHHGLGCPSAMRTFDERFRSSGDVHPL